MDWERVGEGERGDKEASEGGLDRDRGEEMRETTSE